MPEITAIEPQKRKKDRFNIFLDGEFAFGLDLEAVAGNNLKIGQNLSQEEIEKLVLENEVGKILDRVLRFLSYRQRSEKEIGDYLKRRETGPKVVKIIFEKLEKYGYINDLEFAKAWVESRNRSRPKGNIVLRLELYKKGIDREIIDEILENNKSLQAELAKKAAEKKIRRFSRLPYKDFFKKMTAYLLSRGFDWQTTKSTVDSLWEKR